MLTLTLRTDKPEAEIGLYEAQKQLDYEVWTAHRQLAETIHEKLAAVSKRANIQIHDITGIVIYEGPGSFTGLRIGMSVANALAYSIPANIVATSGDDWIADGIESLLQAQHQGFVVPKYGAEAHITQQKK